MGLKVGDPVIIKASGRHGKIAAEDTGWGKLFKVAPTRRQRWYAESELELAPPFPPDEVMRAYVRALEGQK